MATLHTKRLIVIARADVAAGLNAWIKANVDTAGGERTFTVPLEATNNPGVTVAYIAGWTLTANEHDAVRAKALAIEPTLSNKVRIFDVSGMTSEEERAALDTRLAQAGLRLPGESS